MSGQRMRRLGGLLRRGGGLVLATRLLALWKLFRHPATPRSAKVVAALVLGYALSPIDLIPDFIPVIGLLDDLILVPLGIALVVRLTPPELWQARLAEARAQGERLPRLFWGAALVLAIWLALIAALVWGLWALAGAA
jgi:uncharacterized membrane protein YkvA (DUF1232 family)